MQSMLVNAFTASWDSVSGNWASYFDVDSKTVIFRRGHNTCSSAGHATVELSIVPVVFLGLGGIPYVFVFQRKKRT
jgi:hypothetical protein